MQAAPPQQAAAALDQRLQMPEPSNPFRWNACSSALRQMCLLPES